MMEYLPFPDKKYNIIYTDPPWTYRDKASAGKRGSFYKYDLMTNLEIENLPVGKIAADDCFLFLWVTMPRLNEIWSVFDKWGFSYKTAAFTWVKRNKKSDSWFFGMGNFTRSNAELCLLGTRGKPKRVSASVSSVIDTPIEKHSKKPDIVRDKIVELCGDLPRIELFAKNKSEGWDSWGLEV